MQPDEIFMSPDPRESYKHGRNLPPYGEKVKCVANLAFVVAGFVLCYLALRNPEAAETRDVQARLGIIAELIADRFQQPQASRAAEDLQDVFGEFDGKEEVRVGMRRVKGGGWEYCVLDAK
jgi:hypothetical protein